MIQHIAIVPEGDGLSASELSRVSAALQLQISRDVAPIWNVIATVDAFPELEDVPVGYWPLLLSHERLGRREGIHLGEADQPYGQVQLGEYWSLAVSRLCIEMLINPSGTRTRAAQSLRSDQGPVEVLLEPCAPCGAASYAYAIDGVVVSDFCTPAFYNNYPAPGLRYTFTGSAAAPLRPLPGGHLTWFDPISGRHWMRSHWGDNPIDSRLEPEPGQSSTARELVNGFSPLRVASRYLLREGLTRRCADAECAAQLRAHRLRTLIRSRASLVLDPAAQPQAFALESTSRAQVTAKPAAESEVIGSAPERAVAVKVEAPRAHIPAAPEEETDEILSLDDEDLALSVDDDDEHAAVDVRELSAVPPPLFGHGHTSTGEAAREAWARKPATPEEMDDDALIDAAIDAVIIEDVVEERDIVRARLQPAKARTSDDGVTGKVAVATGTVATEAAAGRAEATKAGPTIPPPALDDPPAAAAERPKDKPPAKDEPVVEDQVAANADAGTGAPRPSRIEPVGERGEPMEAATATVTVKEAGESASARAGTEPAAVDMATHPSSVAPVTTAAREREAYEANRRTVRAVALSLAAAAVLGLVALSQREREATGNANAAASASAATASPPHDDAAAVLPAAGIGEPMTTQAEAPLESTSDVRLGADDGVGTADAQEDRRERRARDGRESKAIRVRLAKRRIEAPPMPDEPAEARPTEAATNEVPASAHKLDTGLRLPGQRAGEAQAAAQPAKPKGSRRATAAEPSTALPASIADLIETRQ